MGCTMRTYFRGKIVGNNRALAKNAYNQAESEITKNIWIAQINLHICKYKQKNRPYQSDFSFFKPLADVRMA